MKKRKNSIAVGGDELRIELSTSLKSFDWRNAALGMFIMRLAETSRDYFEALPDDKGKMDEAVCGDAWKESGRVLKVMKDDGKIDEILAEVKKDISSIPW